MSGDTDTCANIVATNITNSQANANLLTAYQTAKTTLYNNWLTAFAKIENSLNPALADVQAADSIYNQYVNYPEPQLITLYNDLCCYQHPTYNFLKSLNTCVPPPVPTQAPTQAPSVTQTQAPTQAPTTGSTQGPVVETTSVPTDIPIQGPTQGPTQTTVTDLWTKFKNLFTGSSATSAPASSGSSNDTPVVTETSASTSTASGSLSEGLLAAIIVTSVIVAILLIVTIFYVLASVHHNQRSNPDPNYTIAIPQALATVADAAFGKARRKTRR
jgi:hypothetical protein